MSDKFIISGEGPILITSPHSISTQRLDSIHVNELYIGDILSVLLYPTYRIG